MRKRSIKIIFNAPITLTFTAICIVALILSYITDGYSTEMFFSTYASSLTNPLTYIRLIGHVFGHQNISHLISNALFILLLGPILEEKYGEHLISVIVVTALVTGIAHNILEPDLALLGASGVVFAFILLASFTGNSNGIPITLILVAILWLGGEIVDGIAIKDSTSQLTHIIGGISGMGMGIYFKRK